MIVSEQQRNQILAYIVEFANQNITLRLELHWTTIFNLGTTGGTITSRYRQPTLNDLQQLTLFPETGLPFSEINLTTRDSGPFLASIKFENGQFTIRFFRDDDLNEARNATELCAELNRIINLQNTQVNNVFAQNALSDQQASASNSNTVRNEAVDSAIQRASVPNLTHTEASGFWRVNNTRISNAPFSDFRTTTNNRVSSAEVLPEKLKTYVNSLKNNKESFSETFTRLKIETDYICPISLMIPNIPVFLDGLLYDFSYLEKLQVENGCRKNPINREKFTWEDVMPARLFLTIFEKLIQDAEPTNTISNKR